MTAPNPTGKGGFVKGQSGNPKGHSKRTLEFLKTCEKYSIEALEVIRDTMKNGIEQSDRLKAAIWLAERAHGKSAQAVQVTGENGGPLIAVIRDK